jgi:pullulanase/glycogen debranching enzyme
MGQRFNHHKLLLDPYAKQIRNGLKWHDAHFGYKIGHRNADLSYDRRDSAPGMLKGIVVDPAFTWGAHQPPRTPWHRTVIYEVHVRGFTMRHPDVPANLRGTYARDGGIIGELAYRITGSSDLYARSGRRPYTSTNFVTAHDGFTLQDLVSYNSKHNQANGEENRDGTENNRSWNCDTEGPSDNPEVNHLRTQQKRNFMATLLLSQGVPMLLAGDEVGHTQGGNNNAYCQDNEVSWLDWDPAHVDGEFRIFVQRLIALRKDHPVFRRRNFFQGRQITGAGIKGYCLAWSRGAGDDRCGVEPGFRALSWRVSLPAGGR